MILLQVLFSKLHRTDLFKIHAIYFSHTQIFRHSVHLFVAEWLHHLDFRYLLICIAAEIYIENDPHLS